MPCRILLSCESQRMKIAIIANDENEIAISGEKVQLQLIRVQPVTQNSFMRLETVTLSRKVDFQGNLIYLKISYLNYLKKLSCLYIFGGTQKKQLHFFLFHSVDWLLSTIHLNRSHGFTFWQRQTHRISKLAETCQWNQGIPGPKWRCFHVSLSRRSRFNFGS